MEFICSSTITDWITAIATIALVILTRKYVIITRIISEAALKAPEKAFQDGLKIEREKHERIVNELTEGLGLIVMPQEGSTFSVRIINTKSYTVLNASVFLTIDYKLSSVLEPREFSSRIRGGHLIPVVEERLCWAHNEGGEWQTTIDIYPQAEQTISLFVFDEKQTALSIEAERARLGLISQNAVTEKLRKIIKVYSSDGVGDNRKGAARVALECSDYTLWIKVVGENLKAKAWECMFHFETNKSYIEKINEIPITMLRQRQGEIRERENVSSYI